MLDSSEVRKAYEIANQEYRVRQSRIGCILILFLIPAGISLDYYVYPNLLIKFTSLRLLTDVIIGFILLLHFTDTGKKHIGLLIILWLLSAVIMIAYMIFLTEGASSTYYAGICLTIIAIGILLPLTVIEVALFCGTSLSIYLASCFLNKHTDIDFSMLFNNVYFLILAAIISLTAVYFNSIRRFNEFCLRHELDIRNKELEKLDQLKSQFFANISHELRTPLTLILSPIQELLQSPNKLTEKVAGLLRTAQDNSLRLLKLVNDLLEITKLEEGKENLIFEPIEINNFITVTVHSMELMAEKREITLNMQLVDEPLVIDADSYALERIFLNLLSNAIKFTPEGGKIDVTSRISDNSAVITISDTGIGVSNEDLPIIFDRFQQADGSTTRKYQGTGIGLALVKELTEKLNGMVSVTSEVGKGTTFILTFPFSSRDYSSADIEQMPVEGDIIDNIHRIAEHSAALPTDTPFIELEGELAEGNRPSILVVDDEPGIRQYIVSILSDSYRVIQARDGAQGLNLAQKYRPDLIVLDLMLPEIDGLEICKRLKNNEATRMIKIVLLTARTDEEVKIIALENGADDFITKPFSKTEVITRINNLITARSLEQDLVARNITLENTLAELKETQVRLIQSEKLNALGTLTAGLMHEINNPLNYSLTALQIAQRDPSVKEDDAMQELLADILEGMTRIRDIVTDLQTFAYPTETQKQTPFSFTSAIDSALRFTAHLHKDINIRKELCDNDDVYGSQSHIIQVLINLISNAIAAVNASQRTIPGEILLKSICLDEKLHFSIKDNGIGIPLDNISKIFDPFFTTRDIGQGMGLGLSICHTIMKNHGDELKVESEDGKWSEFSFSLPLVNANISFENYASVN